MKPSRCPGFPAHTHPDAPECPTCGFPSAAHDVVLFGRWVLSPLLAGWLEEDGAWTFDPGALRVNLVRGTMTVAVTVARPVGRIEVGVGFCEKRHGRAHLSAYEVVDERLDGDVPTASIVLLGLFAKWASNAERDGHHLLLFDLPRLAVSRALALALLSRDRETLAAHRDFRPAEPPPPPPFGVQP